jgi:hypothetical protein
MKKIDYGTTENNGTGFVNVCIFVHHCVDEDQIE